MKRFHRIFLMLVLGVVCMIAKQMQLLVGGSDYTPIQSASAPQEPRQGAHDNNNTLSNRHRNYGINDNDNDKNKNETGTFNITDDSEKPSPNDSSMNTTFPNIAATPNEGAISPPPISSPSPISSPPPISSVSSQTLQSQTTSQQQQQQQQQERCALLFFGLPRSFQLLVLPSIQQNILIPNKDHYCDIFVHFYLGVTNEKGGRSGLGGDINVMEVFLLQDAVNDVYNGKKNKNNKNNNNNTKDDYHGEKNSRTIIPLVSFTNDTEDDFHRKRGDQVHKYRTTKDKDTGQYVYFPWRAPSYKYPTTMDNIVKQWHSIDAVWNHMTRTAQELKRNYTRVAMLRNDVVYMTPFDIYKRGIDTPIDTNNTDVIIPNWARYPVNDRMIYGPHDGVRVWATERFERLETHVKTYTPGLGMHSEHFLNHSIFPAIEELGYGVVTDPDVCFFRARADGSAWINDCTSRNGAASGFRKKEHPPGYMQRLVEDIVGKPCRRSKFKKKAIQVHCGEEEYHNDNGNNATKAEEGA